MMSQHEFHYKQNMQINKWLPQNIYRTFRDIARNFYMLKQPMTKISKDQTFFKYL